MKKFLILLCAALLSNISIAQDPLPEGSPINIPSPDIWRFMKFGNNPVNLYTGTSSVTIPIYEYKDNDFTIPISLEYASDGFIPNTQAGSMGLGWFLNAGGVIIREVKCFPDECVRNEYHQTYKKYSLNGYYDYYLHMNGQTTSEPVLSRASLKSGTFEYSFDLGNGEIAETQPDIFTFNFLNHKGKFTMSDGIVKVYNTRNPHGEYKIDLSNFRAEKDNITYINSISITTGDGYVYNFGSLAENVQMTTPKSTYSYTTNSWNHTSPTYRDAYSILPLRYIQAPNGRSVYFTYHPVETVEFCRQGSYGILYGEHHSCQYYESTIRQLKSIIVDNQFHIDFKYENRPILEKGPEIDYLNINFDRLRNLKSSKCLKEITFSENDTRYGQKRLIKKATLKYHENGDEGEINKLLLKEVTVSGQGTYSMDYYRKNEPFPNHGCSSLDHWGYYNNRRTYGPINPDNRQPSTQGALMGMLGKITYPTKGFTVFQYESHQAQTMVRRSMHHNDYLPTILPVNTLSDMMYDNTVGGLRIKKIIDCPLEDYIEDINDPGITFDDSISTIREYFYDSGGFSHGNLLHFPSYEVRIDVDIYSYPAMFIFKSSLDLYTTSIDKSHIEYSKVIEKLGNGGYTEHYFMTYRDIPDDVQEYGTIDNSHNYKYIDPSNLNYFRPIHSRHSQRGKLKSKIMYDRQGRKVLAEENIYDLNYNLPFVPAVKTHLPSSFSSLQGPKITEIRTYTGDYPLVGKREVTYFGSDSIVNESSFAYNRLGQTSEITSKNAFGDLLSSRKQYITDIPEHQWTEVHHFMVKRNMISFPIRTQTKIKRKGIDSAHKLMKASYQIYGFNRNNPKNPICLREVKKVNFAEPIWCDDFIFDHHLQTDIRFEEYDRFGNLCQITDRNGIPTSYIWGYSPSFLIAEIKNMAYSEVSSIAGIDFSKISPSNTFELEHFKLILRSHPIFKNALITLFEYDPFIGLKKITAPDNRYQTMEYNSEGKLEKIRDEKGHILKEYKYHFKQH